MLGDVGRREYEVVSTAFVRSVGFFAALLSLAFFLSWSVPTLSAEPDDGTRLFQHWERQLDTAQERVDGGVLGPVSSRAYRRLVQEVMDEVTGDRTQSLQEVGRVEELIQSIGPVPEDGSEDPTVRSKRDELTDTLAQYQGRVKRADLIEARAKQILDELSRQSRLRFRDNLLQTTYRHWLPLPGSSPYPSSPTSFTSPTWKHRPTGWRKSSRIRREAAGRSA